MTLSELLEEYQLEMQLQKFGVSTYRNYSRYINRFIEKVGDKDIEKVTNRDAKIFIKEMQMKEFKKKTINLALTSIKSMFNYAVSEEYLEQTPIVLKKLKEDDIKPIDILTEEELQRLCTYNKKERLYTRYRDYCMIITFIDTGARANEIINIKFDDIKDDYIELMVTKNKKVRQVPLSKTLKKALLKLDRFRTEYFNRIDNNDNDEYLFVSKTGKQLHRANVNDVIIKACKKCDIPRHKAYPHNLRHSFACLTMEHSKNVHMVSKLLGHSNISITDIYLKGFKDKNLINQAQDFIVTDIIRK